jgi:hypothetical protein
MCQSNCNTCCHSCCHSCCHVHCYHVVPTCWYNNISHGGMTTTTSAMTYAGTTYECCRCKHRYSTPGYTITWTNPQMTGTWWNAGTIAGGCGSTTVKLQGNQWSYTAGTTGQMSTQGNVTTATTGQTSTQPPNDCKCGKKSK